ncbi:MAG: CBS domain-containing protein [Candidatus Aenigmatarchaeota archaeon]
MLETMVFDEPITKLASEPKTWVMNGLEGLIELACRYRRIPVVDRGGNFNGIITTTDILRGIRDMKNKKIQGTSAKNVPSLNSESTFKDALLLFKQHGRGGYPILEGRKLLSIITEWDMIKWIRDATGIKVKDIMTPRVIVAKSHWPNHAIVDAMAFGPYRRLPVVKNGLLIGILTPADLLSREGKTAEEIMTRDVVTIKPNKDISEAVEIMRKNKIGGLPVVEHERILGIITERDILEAIA